MKWWDWMPWCEFFECWDFKPAFSLSSFNFIKRPLSTSSFSAIRVVSSAYLRLVIFCPAILIPPLASSSPAFHLVYSVQFSLVQSVSRIWLFATPWATACRASLSITNSQSLLKLMSIESVMPFNYLILCYPLLLPASIFPSIRFFSSESVLRIRWPKY